MQRLRRTEMSPAERQTMTILAVGAFIIVLIVWQVAGMDGLLYPLRLFVSLVHELGHGLAAILTGGTFLRFNIYPNGSGVAFTQGGSPLAILPSGYLGAAAFGAVLFVLNNRLGAPRALTLGMAGVIALAVVLFSGVNTLLLIGLVIACVGALLAGEHYRKYRAPMFAGAALAGVALLVLIWPFTALKVGLGMAAVLIALALLAPRPALIFILNFLALIVGLNALSDIALLLNSPNIGLGDIRNDAAALANVTNVPTLFWVILWVVLAGGMMALAAYYGLIQPARLANGRGGTLTDDKMGG